MGKIVVAKKYRLGKDGDKFSEKFKTPIRKRVVIDEDRVKQVNASKAISGQMYEIDEAETKKRDAIVNPKPKPKPPENENEAEAVAGEGGEVEAEAGAPEKKKGGRPPKNK